VLRNEAWAQWLHCMRSHLVNSYRNRFQFLPHLCKDEDIKTKSQHCRPVMQISYPGARPLISHSTQDERSSFEKARIAQACKLVNQLKWKRMKSEIEL
jgi:hypothetical protein